MDAKDKANAIIGQVEQNILRSTLFSSHSQIYSSALDFIPHSS